MVLGLLNYQFSGESIQFFTFSPDQIPKTLGTLFNKRTQPGKLSEYHFTKNFPEGLNESEVKQNVS